MFSGIKKGVLFISGGIACFLVAALLMMVFSGRGGNEPPTVVAGPLPEISGKVESREAQETSDQYWVIYITGNVAHPGVYEVKPGARVNDAVKVAGGLLPQADRISINLAEKIGDGSHIHIPEKSTQEEEKPTVRQVQQQPTASFNSSIVERKTSNAHNSGTPGRIDINSADKNTLQKLPGVGPVTAEKIINYRQNHGEFSGVNDLIRIKGIGEKKLEQIRPLVFAGS